MKLKIFSVYDSAAKAYIPPFFVAEVGLAIREFQGCASDPSHPFCKFSSDFTLFEVGEFDDSNGVISSYPEHVNHGLAASYQVKVPHPDMFKLEGSN